MPVVSPLQKLLLSQTKLNTVYIFLFVFWQNLAINTMILRLLIPTKVVYLLI